MWHFSNLFVWTVTFISFLVFLLSSAAAWIVFIIKSSEPKQYKLFVNGIEDKDAIITEIK